MGSVSPFTGLLYLNQELCRWDNTGGDLKEKMDGNILSDLTTSGKISSGELSWDLVFVLFVVF